MKNKKVLVILIAVVFGVIAIISCLGLFSIKKVQVVFAAHKETNSIEIQDSLNSFLGDNLLFLNLDEVNSVLNEYHYMEVVSLEKSFPNVLTVQLKERREIYYIQNGTNFVVTNEDGFVLDTVDSIENISRDKIVLDLTGVNVLECEQGSYLKTDNDTLMDIIFEMSKSVNLTDNINKISVNTEDRHFPDVNFTIVTGSTITVQSVDLNNLSTSISKVKNAFFVYDTLLTDFEKFTGNIQSFLIDNPQNQYHGCYRVTYNGQVKWTSEKV